MTDLGVIDRFLSVFSQYIDSGFGLLGPEVAFLSATLIVIDITLAGLFWAMGGTDDVLARLIKKTLYVGAFAFIIHNFNNLSTILFRSFAGLGLLASGSGLPESQFLQPGRLAAAGVTAAQPILIQIGDLTGFPGVFLNLDSIVVLFLAWLVVLVSFFVLAVQLFVTLLEFKLTTLAGFILVPFALWNRTAFLAERVLGNVVSSGVKVLVLAVIVGIGTGLFGQFTLPARHGALARRSARHHARCTGAPGLRHLRPRYRYRTRLRRTATRCRFRGRHGAGCGRLGRRRRRCGCRGCGSCTPRCRCRVLFGDHTYRRGSRSLCRRQGCLRRDRRARSGRRACQRRAQQR